MSSFAVSLAFLLTAGQPPAETTAPEPAPVAAPAAQPAAEPKMVCKYEHLTGSRVQKQKVCRPENEASGSSDDSKLQRQLARGGDKWVNEGGGLSSGQ